MSKEFHDKQFKDVVEFYKNKEKKEIIKAVVIGGVALIGTIVLLALVPKHVED